MDAVSRPQLRSLALVQVARCGFWVTVVEFSIFTFQFSVSGSHHSRHHQRGIPVPFVLHMLNVAGRAVRFV